MYGRFSCTWTEDSDIASVIPDGYRSSTVLSMNVFCEQRGKEGLEKVLSTFEDLYPKRQRAIEIVESCRARLAIPADDHPRKKEGEEEESAVDLEKMLDTLLKYGDYDTAPIPFRKISKRGAEEAMAKAANGSAAVAVSVTVSASPLCKTIMAAAAAGAAAKRRVMETAGPVQLFPDNADANADADAAMAVVGGSLAERSSADGGDSSPPLA